MLPRLRSLLLGTALCVGAFCYSARAEDTVKQIVIEGIQRIEPETIRSYLTIQPGDPFDDVKIDRSLRNLFETGLFADVTINREDGNLVVKVVENPIINRLAFEGNKKIETKDLEKELQLRPRTVYTRTKVQADVKRILELYRRKGRFGAIVTPKIVKLPQNRVDLVFEITEGALTGIRDIYFIGNKNFDDDELKTAIRTRESRWWRFLTSDDNYDPDRVAYDRELLRQFYLNHGYADFHVVSAVAELTPDREDFFLTYTIEEGERYTVGPLKVVSHIPKVSGESLKDQVLNREGDFYNASLVEATVNKLTDAVGNLGYAFIDIRPELQRDPKTHVISITYNIENAPRVYVDRIDIHGNVRTLDKVVRREFRVAEGDAFNTAKVKRSEQRLKDLDYFDKVEVKEVAGDQPDRTKIDVKVTEKSTGEISLGAGYSTSIGILGNIAIEERNFVGRGQDVKISTQVGQKEQDYEFSFTEPYFRDKDIAAGFDLFYTRISLAQFAGYNEGRAGFDVRAGYALSENLRQTWTYTLRRQSISNINSANTSFFIQSQQGVELVSAIGETLLYDERDSRVDPTAGWYASLSHEVAGLGGTERYIRNDLGAGIYHDFGSQYVASLTGALGAITGIFGKQVRIGDRYFLGGDTFRGFNYYGIGPRDFQNNALGGKYRYTGTLAMNLPLGLPKDYGITGKVFTDFGSIWGVDVPKGNNVGFHDDPLAPRVATGIGINWKSPMGPIGVDIAYPVIKKSYDKPKIIHISFGTRF